MHGVSERERERERTFALSLAGARAHTQHLYGTYNTEPGTGELSLSLSLFRSLSGARDRFDYIEYGNPGLSPRTYA